MPSRENSLPVYSADKELLYYTHVATVPDLLESGKVRRVGTERRTRGLVALTGDLRDLALLRPPHAPPETHRHETEDNPRGVWSFRKLYHAPS